MPGLGGTRFRRLTGRAAADPAGGARRFQTGLETLETLDAHLAGRDWLVGEGPTIADLSVFAYTHVAGDAGFELAALSRRGGVARPRPRAPGVPRRPRPVPENARPGNGRSIYD